MIKHTLVQIETGTIDLVIEEKENFAEMLLQFNCECKDALPYCKAMCCRMQDVYSAEMTEVEARKLGSRPLEMQSGTVYMMPEKKSPLKNECKYLGCDKLCTIHSTKPEACRRWHCSPQGKGEGIKIFSKGWILLPTRG